MIDIADLLRAARLVAVLTIERVADAVPLARALVAGGVRTLEITLRTPAGADAAAAVAEAVPEAVVGLGTVLTVRDLELTKRLGLPFAFSPGATPELLDAARELSIPFVPGIATASELIGAHERGYKVVKLFPAEQLGGVGALRALGGPFPSMLFNPTGGVTETNMPDYGRAGRRPIAPGMRAALEVASPAATSLAGASQEPPTATTFDKARSLRR